MPLRDPAPPFSAADLVGLIFEVPFMTLATADEAGVPWVSPVEFVCDRALNLYWLSTEDTRHSTNLRANPRAAVSIYDPAYVPLDGQPRAIYAEGPVSEHPIAGFAELGEEFALWMRYRDRNRTVPRPPREGRIAEGSPWRFYRLAAPAFSAISPEGHPVHGHPAPWRVPVELRESFSRAWRDRIG